MAWVDLDAFSFLSTRSASDKYSAADMNSVNDNLQQVVDDIALIVGANTEPTRDLATIESDLSTAEGDISTLQGQVSALGIPYMRYGLELSNAADTDHDITIATGKASSSAFDYVLTLSSAMTKQIDAGWAAGTNAGGLFSGAVGNNTWYAVHLIRKDSDGSIDAGFDTSATAANKPAGYSYYRRIGWVRTDGSANIIGFTQIGNNIFWKAVSADLSDPSAIASTNRIGPITMLAPQYTIARVIANVQNDGSNTNYVWVGSANRTDAAASGTNFDIFSRAGAAVGSDSAELSIEMNASSELYYRTSDVDCSIYIFTKGWIDPGI